MRVRAVETDVWATGFLIGAEGEVVFGTTRGPTSPLLIETSTGGLFRGHVLGVDRGLGLGIGRVDPGAVRRYFAPLRVAREPGLVESRWVVVLKHDASGRPEPFAGIVEATAWTDVHRATPLRPLVAPVMAPAAVGSPVLSARGELVGVALEAGARRTKVAAIESLVPFLKTVVLGHDARR